MVILIVIFACVLIICITLEIPAVISLLLALVFALGVIPYFIIKNNIETKENEKKKEEFKNTEEYKNCVEQYQNLIKKYKSSEYYLEDEFDDYTYYCAIFDSQIHIINKLDEAELLDAIRYKFDDLKKERVYNMDDVRYYKVEGSVHQQQHISGGGGGGSSIKGAVVGGLIAGDAGAIIGSRQKVNEIHTTYVEDDDRRVVVVLKDDNQFDMPFKFYDRLLDYAPEKDYDNYIAAKKEKGRKSTK